MRSGHDTDLLVAARAVQGFGGALVSAVALALTMTLFTDPGERAKAMGIFGFVLSGGGTAGVLLGGVLTDLLDWHWIFLVNLPVGVLVYVLSLRLLPSTPGVAAGGRVDVAGAVTVTGSLILAVYAIVNGNETGWTSAETLGLLGAAALLMAVFLVIEARVCALAAPALQDPQCLVGERRRSPDGRRHVRVVLLLCALPAAAPRYTPLEVGLAYLPAMVVWEGRPCSSRAGS